MYKVPSLEVSKSSLAMIKICSSGQSTNSKSFLYFSTKMKVNMRSEKVHINFHHLSISFCRVNGRLQLKSL